MTERIGGYWVDFGEERDHRRRALSFLAQPEQQEVWCPVISVDDHVIEPMDLFEDQVPARLRESAPRPFYDDQGLPYWLIDDTLYPLRMANSPSGTPCRSGVALR
ncbi:MAG: hypothetical protein ACYDD6_01690 [Acidimicrobiales bacterium]